MLGINYTITIILGLLNAIFASINLNSSLAEFSWTSSMVFLLNLIAVIILCRESFAIAGADDAKV